MTTKPKRKSSAPAVVQQNTTEVQQSVFDKLPGSAFVRLSQLVRGTKTAESETAPVPFSAPTLWRRVKDGSFPKPHKISTRVTAWKVSQVREWLATQSQGVQA